MFCSAGEFHTFRLPVPELWLDIFQKMVAAGFNAVSIYVHSALLFFRLQAYDGALMSLQWA